MHGKVQWHQGWLRQQFGGDPQVLQRLHGPESLPGKLTRVPGLGPTADATPGLLWPGVTSRHPAPARAEEGLGVMQCIASNAVEFVELAGQGG